MKVKKLLKIFENEPSKIIFEFSGLEVGEEDKLILSTYEEYVRYKDCNVYNWWIKPIEDSEEYELHIHIEW